MAQKTPTEWTALRQAVSVATLARARYGEPDQMKSTRTTLQWSHTDHGRLIVGIQGRYENAWRFMETTRKGKGAIDWLITVEGVSLHEAVERLSSGVLIATMPPFPARLPRDLTSYQPLSENPALWPQVRTYLVTTRKLPQNLVDQWHESGQIRALSPSSSLWVPYAAFPLVSPTGDEVGAMLRCAATPDQQRQQIAKGFAVKRNQAGSRPTQGYWPSHASSQAKTLVLVEAPLDGMALYAALVQTGRDPQDFVIRASGGEALNPVHWSGDWEHIVAAFDRDAAGERFSQTVRQANPSRDVRRLVPPPGSKDWAEGWTHVVTSHCLAASARESETDYEVGAD